MLGSLISLLHRKRGIAALFIGLLVAVAALGADGERKAPERIPEGKACADCHGDLVKARFVHSPVTDDCGICHEQQGDGLHKFAFATPKAELCIECHEMENEGSIHEPVKEGRCETCHDPHASNHRGLLKGTMTEVCNACHEKMAGANSKYQHGPFAGGLCMGCHRPHASTSEALLIESGTKLCLSCHEQLAPEGQGDTYWHQPAQEDCSACHHPHGADHPNSLLEPAQDLCLGCHDEIGEKLTGATVQHKAGAEGQSCLGCHLPHASQYSRLLVSESAKLCLTCHDKEYSRENGRPIANIAAEMKEFPNHHGPVREENCEGCHDPHGSAHFRLLTQEYPARFYAPFDEKNYEFCFACHERDIVRLEKTTVTNFRDGERNLHYLHVKRKKGRTCRACHAVHASNQPHHLRETTPFGKWELPVGFSKDTDGGTCASGCHQTVSYVRGAAK